jgi:hypothetical protein
LWHRSHWIRYSEAYANQAMVKNLSFMVVDGSRKLALLPCFAERDDQGNLSLIYGASLIPWPVLSPSLVPSERQAVEECVYQTLASQARDLGIRKIETTSHVLPPSFYKAPFPPSPLPNRFGYTTTAIDTWVMDLTQSPETLWSQVRKGHKSSIKTGQKLFSLQTWAGAISEEDFAPYQELHALAAGRATRNQVTFDIMRDLINQGKALLVGARQNGRWTGFAYIMADKKSAYYASACKHPELPPAASVGHALLWESILALKKTGFEFFELGPQTYPSSTRPADEEKLVNISLFKRGFGGFTMSRYISVLSVQEETLL